MLPVSMVIGQASASARLKSKLAISCLQPGRIPIAGKISTMVFDKTGTITKEGMDFAAVVNVKSAEFSETVEFQEDNAAANMKNLTDRVSSEMKSALGCCHTVTQM